MSKTCPCLAPGVLKTWEAPLVLCGLHARDWLRSPEKDAAKAAIAADDQAGVDLAVSMFIARIQKKPPLTDRVRAAFAALLGRNLSS